MLWGLNEKLHVKDYVTQRQGLPMRTSPTSGRFRHAPVLHMETQLARAALLQCLICGRRRVHTSLHWHPVGTGLLIIQLCS